MMIEIQRSNLLVPATNSERVSEKRLASAASFAV